MNNERIGFVASAGDMYIDDVVVRAINTSVFEEVLLWMKALQGE